MMNELPASRVVLMVAALALLAGCHGSVDETMSEFAGKVETIRARNVPEKEFYEHLGTEPHKTVTVADKAYWYFYCSDGKVILSVDAILLKDEGKVKVYPGIRQIEK